MKGLKALSSLPPLQRRMGSHCPLPPRSPSLRPPTIHAPVSRQPAQKGRVSSVPGGAAHRLPAAFHPCLPPSSAAAWPALPRAFRASPNSQFTPPGVVPGKVSPALHPKMQLPKLFLESGPGLGPRSCCQPQCSVDYSLRGRN